MSEVSVGEHITFEGPPRQGHFGVRLDGTFLHAGDSIPVDDTLPAFFADLGELWRGWPGERVWEAPLGNLRLAARHDRIGHVLIAATVRDVGVDEGVMQSGQWSAMITVEVEPAALATIASALREMLEGADF